MTVQIQAAAVDPVVVGTPSHLTVTPVVVRPLGDPDSRLTWMQRSASARAGRVAAVAAGLWLLVLWAVHRGGVPWA